MYPYDMSQMPPMMAQGGMMGGPQQGPVPPVPPVGGSAAGQPQIPTAQPNPNGALPQGQSAMNPANPVNPAGAPSIARASNQGPPIGSNPITNNAPSVPSMSSNMMGQPGTPAPTPGTNPAIPDPLNPKNNPVQLGQSGAQKSISAIPSKGKTSTGRTSGSLNDIAEQIMTEGMMGGQNSAMGSMGGMM